MPVRASLTVALWTLGFSVAQGQELDARLHRTWAAPNLTVVDGLLAFDPALVRAALRCTYVIGVTVTDPSGTEILRDEWSGTAGCAPSGERGRQVSAVLESFQFAVTPGRYAVEVTVAPDGALERTRRTVHELESLPAPPRASDLFLSHEIGHVEGASEGVWTVRRGPIGLTAAPTLAVTPERATASYYLELYAPEGEMAGEAIGVIRAQDDDAEVLRLDLGEVVVTGVRPLAGTIPLTGLPAGDYRLEVTVDLGSSGTITRSAPFRMAEPPAVRRELELVELDLSRQTGYFWSLTDEELERLFDPIVLWLETEDQRATYKVLTPDGKRRFLRQYFEGQEPTRDAGVHQGEASRLDLYLSRIRYVSEHFGERAGRGAQDAWRTDRGQIYLMRGEPDERVEQAYPRAVFGEVATRHQPYVIWFYEVGPGYVYLFVDDTKFGHYRLLFSTDPNYPSAVGWEQKVTQAALEDVSAFFKTAGQPRFTY